VKWPPSVYGRAEGKMGTKQMNCLNREGKVSRE